MRRALIIARVVWLDMLRRKDLYVMAILLLTLLFVLMSLNLFGLGAVIRYILDVGLLLAWLFSLVLVVGLAARQLPREESRGTIFPLLAKPVTRGELLLGKWLGSWTASVFATLAFYLLILLLVALRGGTVDRVCLVQALGLHATALALVGALALALSTRMTYGAAAAMTYVACAAGFLVAPAVPELLAHEPGPSGAALMVLYYALPHLELFDLRQRLIHDWGPVSWPDAAGIAVYGLVWAAILLILAWLAYRKKRFRRGAVE
ncbi:MAG: ABC transporter permease [Verrucomicrobia bacterium]|nr:ABC transporter permease [Verrucomicrobiota bacterium]